MGLYLRNPIEALVSAARQAAEATRPRIALRNRLESSRLDPTIFNLRPMHRHPWVYRAINAKVNAVQTIPFRVYKRGSDGKLQPMPQHPVAKLLARPGAGISSRRLWGMTERYMQYRGNAYWLIVRGERSQEPMGIGIMRPERTKIVPAEDGTVMGYLYSLPAEGEVALRADEVIHFRLDDSDNDYYGLSPVEVLSLTLRDDLSARAWNYHTLRNQAIPKGALLTDKFLTKDKADLLREQWEKFHQGASENAGRIAILHSGAKFEAIGLSAQEMDYINRLKWNRDEIGGIYGVPPIKMGSYEEATYNNSREQNREFWRDTIGGDCEHMADIASSHVWQLGAATGEDIVIAPDMSRVYTLQQDRLDAANTQVQLVQSGILKGNEVREEDGRDPTEWGDDWWRSVGLVRWDEEAVPPELSLAVKAGMEEVEAREPHPDILVYSIVSQYFLRMVAGFTAAVFDHQRADVLARLAAFNKTHRSLQRRPPRTAAEIQGVLFDLSESNRIVASESKPMWARVVKRGGQIGWRQTGQPGAFDITDPRAAEYLKAKAQTFAKKINETTWRQMAGELGQAAERGDSFEEVVKRINEAFGHRRANVYTIGRTEINGGLNGGALLGYRQTRVVIARDWIDAGDDHVRDAHRNVKRAPIGQPFMVGGYAMDHPGDGTQGAPAELIVECRCGTSPVLKESKKFSLTTSVPAGR